MIIGLLDKKHKKPPILTYKDGKNESFDRKNFIGKEKRAIGSLNF